MTSEDWATLARAGGATFPRHPWVGCPCAEEVPKEATVAPQAETKAERKEAGRPGAMDFVPKTLGWGVGGSGVLRGARAAGVGVGRGCSLQGASAGLRGRQQRGRVAISGVCVEVQPPVSFAQRQIVSFAQTGAFPPPETQGETGAGRVEAGGGKSETEAELRRRAAPRAASPRPPSGLAWLSGRSVGGPLASGPSAS